MGALHGQGPAVSEEAQDERPVRAEDGPDLQANGDLLQYERGSEVSAGADQRKRGSLPRLLHIPVVGDRVRVGGARLRVNIYLK